MFCRNIKGKIPGGIQQGSNRSKSIKILQGVFQLNFSLKDPIIWSGSTTCIILLKFIIESLDFKLVPRSWSYIIRFQTNVDSALVEYKPSPEVILKSLDFKLVSKSSSYSRI